MEAYWRELCRIGAVGEPLRARCVQSERLETGMSTEYPQVARVLKGIAIGSAIGLILWLLIGLLLSSVL